MSQREFNFQETNNYNDIIHFLHLVKQKCIKEISNISIQYAYIYLVMQ